ncbi:hypothetical protein [Burkholderia metallica]|uniref:hypothetical protein n=1 Tax=Burkholderia metallica TaxID=488729 RepID=UPI000D1B9B0F
MTAGTFAGALDTPGMQSRIQNLSVLLMALSRIPPEEVGKAVFAAAAHPGARPVIPTRAC